MYKIISITDKQGNDKSHYATLDHPQLLGDFYYLDMFKVESQMELNHIVVSYGQMIAIR